MPPDGIGFDDVYILSIPSFTWIKWYPSDNSTGNPHGWSTCNVIDGAQMIIIGGTFPVSQECDAQGVQGTHNLDLGKQNNESAMWHTFQPNVTAYVVPTEIVAKIGGSYVFLTLIVFNMCYHLFIKTNTFLGLWAVPHLLLPQQVGAIVISQF